MAKRSRNHELRSAQASKKDEFYTTFQDIELEMESYKDCFVGRVVYCNCDDPRFSNFFRYFCDNFEALGLKKVMATCFTPLEPAPFGEAFTDHGIYAEYTGEGPYEDTVILRPLKGDGDFRSEECVGFLKEADVVVSNPPFSLAREYLAQLVEFRKDFAFLGNMNIVTDQKIFSLFVKGQIGYGPSIRSGDRAFRVPEDYPLDAATSYTDVEGNRYIRVKGVRWFTNLTDCIHHQRLHLEKNYSPEDYPKYANFDAIEVSKTKDIPLDYAGPMGVPLTFLDKYNPQQFEILGSSEDFAAPMSKIAEKGTYTPRKGRFFLPRNDGTYQQLYFRIVIRHR